MKVFLLLSLLVGAVLGSDVIEYTDADFNDNIGSHELILVEFFAPWCGHCKKLAPEYEIAATALLKEDPPVALAKVDCIANKETCSAHGVSGYPTLKVFRNGEASDYGGPREAAGIIKYMKKQAGPKATVLASAAELEKFIGHFDASVVGFFSDETSSDVKEFKKLTDSLFEDFRFAYTLQGDLAEKYSVENKVILFRPQRLKSKFEESQVVHEGANKKKDIEAFIRENIHGLCGHMTPDNMNQFNKKPLLTAYFEVNYELNTKGTNYWRNRVMKVGKDFADLPMHFAIANAEDFGQKLDEFGLSPGGGAPVVTVEGSRGEKFPMHDTFTTDGSSLRTFIQKFADGELEAYLKSEDVPDPNDDPVKVVVAKNFEEIVNDPTKDVLIEFYAPWCGHCKSLAPKYDELAEKLIGDENIVIAKMDATANDVPPQYSVRGFPTLYWASKGNKSNPKKYEGGREVDDFVKFIKKEASNKPVNTSGRKEEL